MRNKILSFTIASMLGFSGCASSYQPDDHFTGGYSETQLTENIFNVAFNGNGFTSQQQASDFALLRSAEITINNGYKYFIISKVDNYINTSISGNKDQIGSSSEPKINNTIVCFKGKPEINDIVYEAEFIIKSIKTKYEIK